MVNENNFGDVKGVCLSTWIIHAHGEFFSSATRTREGSRKEGTSLGLRGFNMTPSQISQ